MSDLFSRPTEEIIAEAIATFRPARIFAGFSGGNDSLALAHWMMVNVPGAELFHIKTGIGIQATTDFACDTAAQYGWPLTVIRSNSINGGEHCYKTRHSWAKAVLRAMGNQCEQCGWNEARCDVHHRQPKAKGGKHTIANGMVVCPNCHRIAHEAGG